ncbi:hypothetical protein ACFU7X_39025 [Streptomyces chartreusis]|uniref:hypothetical protein n=1 Tax=Streptomyces chartreusis TaxID=1969 RepID=UPI0036944F86
MSDTTTKTTELTSQYCAQVAGDLERNLAEQARVTGEVEALQAQLVGLQHDHSILVNIQQALDLAATPAAPAAEPVAAVPSPRKKASGSAEEAKGKAADVTTSKTRSSSSPTLVALVREYLASLSEPRSAAEIATALGQRHPERTVKATVVRTTLEGLVARNLARRSKQGKSVFYVTADLSEGAVASEQSDGQSD